MKEGDLVKCPALSLRKLDIGIVIKIGKGDPENLLLKVLWSDLTIRYYRNKTQCIVRI